MSSGSRPQFIFLARHYNDIDHTVPVIWGLLKNGVAADRIRYVVLIPDPSIEPAIDNRLIYLRDKGVELELPHINTPFRSLLHTLSMAKIGRFLRRKIRKRLYRKEIRNTDNLQAVVDIIQDAPPNSVLIADHSRGEALEGAVAAAKKLGFATVTTPHGLQLSLRFHNPVVQKLVMEPDETTQTLASLFDHVLVTDPTQATQVTKKGDKGIVATLGAPRFSPEWLEQLSTIYPVSLNERSGSKLKVVMLMEKGEIIVDDETQPFLDIDEQFRALEYLKNHPGVELKIKGNARGLSHRQGKMFRRYRHLSVEDAVPTNMLISWADVTVASCSSVLMDAYGRHKPVLTLEYVAGMDMAFEKFGYTGTPKSFEEFRSNVDMLVEDRNKTLYDQSQLDTLVNYFVYGDRSCHCVVDTYADYLMKLAK